MTVAELSPIELYSLVTMALVMGIWLPVFAYRAYNETTWTGRQKAMWWAAGGVLWGLPVFYTCRYIFLG